MNNEKDNREAVRKKFPLRARFEYWFDNRMAKGSLGLIRALIIASLVFAILMSGLIILLGFSEEGEEPHGGFPDHQSRTGCLRAPPGKECGGDPDQRYHIEKRVPLPAFPRGGA